MVSGMDYEQLYNSYYMQVYSFVMTLAKSRDLAEELTQQVFYKAMVTRADFAGGSGELTWLCAIAKNLFYDEMRQRKRLAPGALPKEDLPSGEDVEKAAADADTAYRIHVILHGMEIGRAHV